MPYKPYAGTPGYENQKTNMAAKEMDDVAMQEAFAAANATGNAAALAAAQAGKKFFPKKFGGVTKVKPVPAAVRKRRINFRLRKILTPKSPLMVLNEIVGGVNYTFVDTPTSMLTPGIPHLFTAQCTVDNETFSGTGPSKQIAKNICAEHVIQHVVTKKSSENKVKADAAAAANGGKPVMEDDTPWLQLASLAMFKLFNDWQAQGFVIPAELLKSSNDNGAANGNGNGTAPTSGGDVTMTNVGPPKAKQAKKVPDNPTERHPVQLLNELRGGVTYNVVGSSGVTPNIIFTMGCEIEGVQYTGVGRNKKDAKKHCAMEALKALYEIQYPGTLTAEQTA